MADIQFYSNAYGQKVQARTWQSTIASASSIAIAMKNLDTAATATLVATAIASYPAGTEHDPIASDEYGVETTIASGWAATRTGKWVCCVQATYATGLLVGEPFTLEILANPTAA